MVDTWDINGHRVLLRITVAEFGCKYCGAKAIVRYGMSPQGEQNGGDYVDIDTVAD